MKLIFVLVTVFTSLSTLAISYEGSIVRTATNIKLIDSTSHVSFKLRANNDVINQHINKLKTGDYLSVDGNKVNVDNSIDVKSINYVGLKLLLGVWFSDDDNCYIFNSHTSFSISKMVNGTCLTPRSMHYTYLLNPGFNTWVMLISGQYSSYLGEVSIKNSKSAQIQLYDSETGDILKSLNLKK